MENKTTMTTELPVNRTYKSTVFTMLYADKSNLLDLYNAMAGNALCGPGALRDQYAGECDLYDDQK